MSAAFEAEGGGDAHRLADAGAGASLRVRYVHGAAADAVLADPSVLAVVGFGNAAPLAADPRFVRVALRPIGEPAPLEVWSVRGPVSHGRDGDLAYARDQHLQLVSLRVPEHGDIRAAGRDAYAQLTGFVARSAHPHPLRVWNYFDAITEGEGDAERYRQFCIGRAEGMGDAWAAYPAATAIGCGGRERMLQVYALSARRAGLPVENPRQVSAYRYPRQYGPQAPSFARAMLGGDEGLPLLLSGTASVVGHATAHPGDLPAQLQETCNNLERLLAGSRERVRSLPAQLGSASTLKVYLRDPAAAAATLALLGRRYPGAELLLLEAEVCRRDLLVEIDGFHGP